MIETHAAVDLDHRKSPVGNAAIVTWPQGAKKPKTEQLHNLAGKFNDYGIDDNFIKQTQDQVTEGASALFLLRYQFEGSPSISNRIHWDVLVQ